MHDWHTALMAVLPVGQVDTQELTLRYMFAGHAVHVSFPPAQVRQAVLQVTHRLFSGYDAEGHWLTHLFPERYKLEEHPVHDIESCEHV